MIKLNDLCAAVEGFDVNFVQSHLASVCKYINDNDIKPDHSWYADSSPDFAESHTWALDNDMFLTYRNIANGNEQVYASSHIMDSDEIISRFLKFNLDVYEHALWQIHLIGLDHMDDASADDKNAVAIGVQRDTDESNLERYVRVFPSYAEASVELQTSIETCPIGFYCKMFAVK